MTKIRVIRPGLISISQDGKFTIIGWHFSGDGTSTNADYAEVVRDYVVERLSIEGIPRLVKLDEISNPVSMQNERDAEMEVAVWIEHCMRAKDQEG